MTSEMRAFITGVAGQDGAYLSQLLLDKGYQVFGLLHRSTAAVGGADRLRWLGVADRIQLVEGDLTEIASLTQLIRTIEPHEVYNLAAQSAVKSSWDDPLLTCQVTALGAINVLEALRIACPTARFFQASSSEMFGNAQQSIRDEQTPFSPRSPYGTAKVFAHHMTTNYRVAFGIHASSGILFNHESPLRDVAYLPRKVTDAVARIKLGIAKELALGNIDVRRDWGHARDYVHAMWLMLQQDKPDDYVIATGRSTSVRDFCNMAFGCVGLRAEDHVVSSQDYLRPAEIHDVVANPAKANATLHWHATTTLEQLIREMVDADLARYRAGMHQP
jgi:GDPmannose 4,6-dehydratase